MITLTKQDLKESAAIERRRRLEEERKSRIFNPRVRTIGIDRAALEKQIIEHKCWEEEEKDKGRRWDQQRIRDSEYAILLHKKLEADRRLAHEEINRFSSTYQQKETRREFDLYDPDALKKQIPPRIHDDDPRCGVSSGQKFDGEDLACKTRLKYQQEQFRSWLVQQKQEKQRADEQRNAYELDYSQILMARDDRSIQIEAMQNDVKRKLNETILRYNMALAEDTANRQQLNAYRECEMNNTELYNAMTGDFLTENPEMHISALGSHRVIPYMYKGMSEQQQLEIRNQQQQQMKEKKIQQERASCREAEWDQLANSMATQVSLLAIEAQQNKRKLNEHLLRQNKQLAMEQKSHQEYLNKFVFTNEPTASYFQQFNTSTR